MEYTFTKGDEYGLLKDGDYEVIIERAEVKTLISGKQKLAIMYRVRSDIEQSGKGKCIFEDIWAEKDNPNYFNRNRINKLLGTQDVKDGTVFDDIGSIIQFLTGRFLIVHIATVFDDYHGEDVNTVSYYKTTKKPNVGETLLTEKEETKEEPEQTVEVPF